MDATHALYADMLALITSGRDTEPLPPLASFYRHNNFGREVVYVDSGSDIELALAIDEAQKEVRAAYVSETDLDLEGASPEEAAQMMVRNGVRFL